MKSFLLVLGALSSINATVIHLKLMDVSNGKQEPLVLDPVLGPEDPQTKMAQRKSKDVSNGVQEPLVMDPVLAPPEKTPTQIQ